jgi:hypothetical protein
VAIKGAFVFFCAVYVFHVQKGGREEKGEGKKGGRKREGKEGETHATGGREGGKAL